MTVAGLPTRSVASQTRTTAAHEVTLQLAALRVARATLCDLLHHAQAHLSSASAALEVSAQVAHTTNDRRDLDTYLTYGTSSNGC